MTDQFQRRGSRNHKSLGLKAKFFRGLADRSRLSILEVLREGPMRVSVVARISGLSQPNASMHLDCLWECGLVEREVGRRITVYRIRSKDVLRLLEVGERILKDVRERIAACARYKE